MRRIRLTLLAIGVVLAVMLWVGLRPAPVGGGGVEMHPAHRIPLTDVAPYGANFFLEREADPWVRRKTVEMAREAGIRWAKQQFLWAHIEPEPGAFDFDAYDDIVELYRENDMEVIARLDWPPAWVTKADWVPESFASEGNAPPADPADYARFVAATVAHFGNRVRFYQIWNEPNLVAEWGFNPSHPVNPAEYVSLLAPAAAAARSVNENVVILSAPLAMNVESTDLAGNMSDLDYLRGMYEAGAAEHFDVLSANAFGMDEPPEAPPGADHLNFRRVELQRELMREFDDEDTPIWLNEYGWNAAPATAKEAIWRSVDEGDQAAWTVDGVRWADEHWPWAGVMSLWYFRQWGGLEPDRAVYYFRLVDVDFTPRRVYSAIQADADERFVAGLGVWQERSAPVRMPIDTAERDRWHWVWDEDALDRNALTSSEPGASIGFVFRGSSVGVRALTGPQAGSLQVVLDGRPVAGPEGATIWALQGGEREWRWFDLAQGLGEGPHELVLTVGLSGGSVSVDALRVNGANGPGDALDPALLGLALLGAFLAILLLTDARRALGRMGA